MLLEYATALLSLSAPSPTYVYIYEYRWCNEVFIY